MKHPAAIDIVNRMIVQRKSLTAVRSGNEIHAVGGNVVQRQSVTSKVQRFLGDIHTNNFLGVGMNQEADHIVSWTATIVQYDLPVVLSIQVHELSK